jgi:hypothetical protein
MVAAQLPAPNEANFTMGKRPRLRPCDPGPARGAKRSQFHRGGSPSILPGRPSTHSRRQTKPISHWARSPGVARLTDAPAPNEANFSTDAARESRRQTNPMGP